MWQDDSIAQSTICPKDMDIHQLITIQAERSPDAMAITAPGRRPLSFGRLHHHIDDMVAKLNALGVGRNDRVAMVLPNGPEMAVAFLAVSACSTSAPLNPAYRAKEYDFYLSDLNAKVLLIESGLDSPARAVAQARGIPLIELWPLSEGEAGLLRLRGDERAPRAPGGLAGPDDVALVLHTSGTTSRPKLVPLTHTNLCASAHHIGATLRLTPADRCLNVMPLFHIHGLMAAVLASLAAGGSVVCTPGFYAPQFFAWLDSCRPTWYTAVPTMHQAILARAAAHPEIIERRPLRFIRSSSSALPPPVLAELERVFQVPVIEAYGMTEAAHQMASNPLPPGRRKSGSVGRAAGPEVAIMDEAGQVLPPGEMGEIVIRGANVTSGYEHNPRANQGAFSQGWFRTGDQGYVDSEGYLFISGRLKEIINRGGEKISPREVDEALMDHPAVAQVVTFALPDPKLGEEIAAAVVLREGSSATEKEIQQFAAERLADFKVPRRVVLLDEIPKGPTGKLQRIGLAERLGLSSSLQGGPGARPEYAAPRTPVEITLADIWSQVLGIEKMGIHDDFFQLGGDSVLATQVIARARQALSVEISILAFFDTPTIAGLAEGLMKSVAEPGSQPPLPSLKPIPRDGEVPLSYAQERLWFLDQFEAASPVYNRPVFLRLTGRLNRTTLVESLNEIVRRHEVLRSRFPTVEGRPTQVIAPRLRLALPVVDLRDWPEEEREGEAQRRAVEEAERPFDLTREPLVRATLLRLGQEEHWLLLMLHHTVFDGGSMEVLLRELAALYDAFSRGEPSPLKELPLQYADFAAWQRQWLQDEVMERQWSYWREQLGGQLPALDLPSDRPRPPIQTYRGAQHIATLWKGLSESLKALSQRQGVTLFMTLLAAFVTLLHRITGQHDILVGAPVSGRSRVEIEELIGCFINTLVLRMDLSGNPRFRELLSHVRELALEAYVHQDLPFEKLVEQLQPERDLSRSPLFQVLFQLKRAPGQGLDVPNLRIEELECDIRIAKFDLALEAVDKPDGLDCMFEFNTDLFDQATIERMAGHFSTLLEGIVANPEERLSDIPLLTEAERHQVLVEWNETQGSMISGQSSVFSDQACLHKLFEAQVERRPDAVAVVYEGEQLTYRELNARANQLAHHLQKLGVGPEVRVGISLERSLQMIIGLLGTLKAGGSYVPLDPTYPKERLEFIVQDSQPQVLLTQEWLRGRIQTLNAPVSHSSALIWICLDSAWKMIGRESEKNPTSFLKPDNLAYIIYTSGSTGQPKGVMITHRSICNRLLWGQETYQRTESDRVIQHAPLCFDTSIWEIFIALLAGARLILARFEEHLDIANLAALIAEQGVTIAGFVPSMLRSLLEEPGFKDSPSLRHVFLGGEVLPFDLQERFFDRLSANLYNCYGPTEASVDMTHWTCQPGEVRGKVPIGKPIGNTQVYLLDPCLQPVPIGVAGELYIGGAGLARGYLHHPDLTAERFIPHPFSKVPGARLYKTGDLARYLPDGNIEFLGRSDHQVKIRGFRIELEEIEAVLTRHPAVREAVVLAREHSSDEKRLVAYLVPMCEESPSISQLRRFLKKTLPEYMIPATFVTLDALPLTANGKVDHRALPAPDQTRPEMEAVFVPPRTPVEEALAGIWAGLLQVERIGIEDNFFELGGHSLLATQVMSRVRSTFQVELPLRRLFEAPTVAGLAKQIESTRRARQGLQAPPLRPVPRDGELPLSFAQQRLWFLDQLEPGSSAYNMFHSLRLRGPLNLSALNQSFSQIGRRHESLRTTFPAVDGRPVQVISAAHPLTLPVVDLQHLPETEREAEARRRVAEAAQQSFDLARGPLWRATLLRLGEEDHVLLLTMHHIVSDGWSMGVFFRELSLLYGAFSRGMPSPLADLPIQYADFAQWQRQWLQGEVLQAYLSYWKGQLAGTPVLELPTDHPRPAIQTFRGARAPLALGRSLIEAVKALSRRQGVSLFMMLLAAFKTLLYHYTEQDDISVGTFIANRNRAEIEGLIGFFVNNLVLRTDLSGNPSFPELLTRVRDITLGAYDHQDVPFEKLLEELRPERSLSYTPLFQVMLVLQNAPTPVLELPDLTVSGYVEMDRGRSHFDFTLWLFEGADGLTGSLEYNADLFNAATVSQMVERFRTLLERIVTQPEQRLSALSVLTDAERRQLMRKRERARSAVGTNASLHPAASTPGRDPRSQRTRLWEKREQLSAAKRALLEKRLRGQT